MTYELRLITTTKQAQGHKLDTKRRYVFI